MLNALLQRIAINAGLIILSYSASAQRELPGPGFDTKTNSNRLAAEWEPALGTMITWPLCVPYKLAIELAKDNHLYTLVANEDAKKEAEKWYNKWGINSAKNIFVYTPQGIDAWWVRDWGPGAVFMPNGTMKLADGKYIYATPVTKLGCEDSLQFIYKTKDGQVIKTEIDDSATVPLANGLKMEVLDLPFISTGGNVITDGLGTAFSTCALVNENKFYGVDEENFRNLNNKLLGLGKYNIISNFEKVGIQHIDCFMKMLDEERILVAQTPTDHELYPIYENIVQNELKQLKNAYGRPYEILRIKTDRYNKKEHLAAYTNSLIINKTIYVPLFHIKADSAAIKKWREVMPGYIVKGFEFSLFNEPVVPAEMKKHYNSYGWNFGDALHCRTRAVWDPQMLFISAKRIDAIVDVNRMNVVSASIIDYSKKGLKQEPVLFWKVVGQPLWNRISLKPTGIVDHFSAEIPYHQAGKVVEYYISAESRSGRKETMPRVAPEGSYRFLIK